MLKGAGIHQNFGWKPVGKFVCAPASQTHSITLPCDFERTVKIISQWDLGEIVIRINADGGANYDYSIHAHGRLAGAASHTQAGGPAASCIYLTQGSSNNCLIETLLQKYGNLLMVSSHAVARTDANNFRQFNVVGFYNAAGPYLTMQFRNESIQDMVGEVQFFESVYGF